MDGARGRYRLAGAELIALTQELSADVNALPTATCRICAAQGLGEVGIDEYGCGAGFGVSVELVQPPGGHLLGSAVRRDWMAQQTLREQAPRAGIVTEFARCRAFLSWLASVPAPNSYQLYSAELSAAMARDNPPGSLAGS
jgi:hypothetical protein